MAKIERVLVAFVAALSACASCDSSTGGSGGETHWLDECDADSDCGGGSLSCYCGVCTRGCRGDDECPGAICYTATSPGIIRRCGSDVADSAGICLNVCSGDGDCAADEVCTDGKCVRGDEPDAAPPKPQTPNDIAGKYRGVDAGVSFETEVTPPTPRFDIEGSDALALVGTWVEVEEDGSKCRPDRFAFILSNVRCATLVIENDGTAVRGTVTWVPSDRSALSGPHDEVPVGPFVSATDGSRGYPEETDPLLYRYISREPVAHVPYRILDGVFSEGQLRFTQTPYQIWNEWCALQTPYAHRHEGTLRYRCVPEGANASNADLGRLALCSSGSELGLCDDRGVCACDHELEALCKWSAMCSCSAAGCGANWREPFRFEGDVDLEGGAMRLRRERGQDREEHVFRRVSP